MKDIISKILKEDSELIFKMRSQNNVFLKDDSFDLASIVSDADIASESFLIKKIKENFPNDSIYSEEKGLVDNASNRIWYIDPLDGTSNFVREIPIWGITMGLVDDGVPVIGAMYFPEFDKFFFAELGKGATVNDKPIHVSKRVLNESLFYSRSYYKKHLYLDTKIGKEVGLVKIVDSSAFELSQIASGNAEIYAMTNVPHDVVSGIVLVKEAGGKVTDFEGNNWNLESSGIIVTNGVVHKDVVRLIDKSLYK